MGWEFSEFTLDELGFLGRGKSKHRPRNDPSLFGGKYPFIQTGDVRAVNLYLNNFEQTYNDKGLAQSKLWNKDTLIITIAANIAETAVLRVNACFPDSIVGFIPNEDLVDVYFVKYYIDYIKREMQSISHGTTQDNLSLDKLRTFKLKVPQERATVSKISTTLLNYDNLIENNNRRIAILEDMAQSLYREWFVNFRYPGHANQPDGSSENEGRKPNLIDSPLGPIPEGWEVKVFSESFNFWNGKKCVKSELGEFALYGANGIVGKTEDWKYENAVIIGRVGAYCGAVEYCFNKFWGSDNTIIAKCKSGENISYLYLLLEHFNLNKYAGGSAQPLLTQTTLKQLKYVVPPEDLINEFEKIAHKLYEGVVNLKKRNNNLKQQRDMLLPKLISGQIQLKD